VVVDIIMFWCSDTFGFDYFSIHNGRTYLKAKTIEVLQRLLLCCCIYCEIHEMTKHRYLASKFQKVISSTLCNIFFNNFVFYKFLSFFLSLLIFNSIFLFLLFFSIFIVLSRKFTNTFSPIFQMLPNQAKGKHSLHVS